MAAAEKDEMPSQVAAGLKIFPRGNEKGCCRPRKFSEDQSDRVIERFTCKKQPPGARGQGCKRKPQKLEWLLHDSMHPGMRLLFIGSNYYN
jgi:hypothetical protein